ncbi:hypothetical protein EDC96DRAFT_578841 [Choanephora cucurbitarum]|nr:hypothetical protein EDC96DRAFT_578841 [Choanephora cucurbitarum]
MSVQTLYEKALRSYLLRKYTSASNTCLKALAKQDQADDLLKINIWTLYLNITSTLLETTPFLGVNLRSIGIEHASSIEEVCRIVWRKVVEGFDGLANARIVSACLVMDLKLNQQSVAREITEEWLASLPDSYLDQLGTGAEDQEDYIGVIELYSTRILPCLGDFESAEAFVEYNPILSDAKKKSLFSLLNDKKQAIEKERQEKQKHEEAARSAAEEKRREIEKRQLEEARQLEKEKEELEEAKQLEEKREKIIETKDREIKTVELSTSAPSSRSISNMNTIQQWINQLKSQSITTSGMVLFALFALFTLLRGQRGRLSAALQRLLNKLWQTVQMGTKVTYM